jgi:hypothetical protein
MIYGPSTPPAIGTDGRMLVSSEGGNWLLDEASGQVIWSGEKVQVADRWNPGGPGFPTSAQWLPDHWASDADGKPVMVHTFYPWEGVPPALSGDRIIGWGMADGTFSTGAPLASS